jgi:polyisoprenoid-binding protein YceI
MRVSATCLLWRALPLLPALLLCGCPLRPQQPAAAAMQAPPPPAANIGTPYDISDAESLLTVLAFKGGALAGAGHNHVIASHELSGSVYVAADVLQTTFEIHVPVTTFTVDESELRAQEHSSEFPPGVPDSARAGTLHNMLGEALLDGDRYPEIVLRAVRLRAAQPGVPGTVIAEVQASVRDEPHTFELPVHYEQRDATIVVSGETALKQSELGLKPFSAMLGALVVQDEMRVRFRIVAHAARAAPAAR